MTCLKIIAKIRNKRFNNFLLMIKKLYLNRLTHYLKLTFWKKKENPYNLTNPIFLKILKMKTLSIKLNDLIAILRKMKPLNIKKSFNMQKLIQNQKTLSIQPIKFTFTYKNNRQMVFLLFRFIYIKNIILKIYFIYKNGFIIIIFYFQIFISNSMYNQWIL